MEELKGRGMWGVFVLCVAIFFTDASNSSTIPTFPFFADGLGASVSVIGLLASVSGISTTLLSIPLGVLSDRVGRRGIMFLGVGCFVLGPIMFTLASDPLHLVPARAVLGIAQAATFSIGFVYVSEITPMGRRSLA